MNLIIFIPLLLLSLGNGPSLRKEYKGPMIDKEEEQDRPQEIHKPGQLSEERNKKWDEEFEEVKDAAPQYDPIDGELEQNEGAYDE